MTAYALFDNIEVTDPAGMARYAEGAAREVAAHGGRYLTGGPAEVHALEGAPFLTAAVLIEFPDLAAARAWYDSPAYQPLKELRHRSARNTAVLFSGPEPS